MQKRIQPILALDPGLRDLGFALLSGSRLLTSGVLPLRHVPHRLRSAEAISAVQGLIVAYHPRVLVLEATYRHPLPTFDRVHQLARTLARLALRGRELLGFGVHTLRNGDRPHDVIGQAKRIVLGYIAKYGPEIVAIERPLPIPTKRVAVLSVIAQELHERAKELDLKVIELAPAQVREIVAGSPRATKLQAAEAVLKLGFEQLRPKLPKPPVRAALGLRPGERYWLHVFDALALAVAAEQPSKELA